MNSSGILRVDRKKLINSEKFKKDCEDARRVLGSSIELLNKRRVGSYIPKKDPAWHDKVFESFLNDLEKVLDERDIELRLKNLTAKEIVDNTIEFSNWMDRQGWWRSDTFFGKHDKEIEKKKKELFWWRYPPYLKIKTFNLLTGGLYGT